MKTITSKSLVYRNAIEPMVVQEVEHQLQQLPPKMLKYIDPIQVVAYALNRLPALYATSEEGWHWQQLRAKTKLKEQITTAVRQALVAVQSDPLKVSTPLKDGEVNPTLAYMQDSQFFGRQGEMKKLW
ncbi:late competence development ComFB family protein [Phormidium sp. LEGE 05292]|uniref:late competence development ComFB family protein n=1 Tax=[Phormidium] sp. LEGE 05292 TaxID=767427 RepID=UPI00187FF7A8|nr:late competence development ComFB family protein [Phormidium sp. LEGE 05292]MBE9226394.1 late competence development ComFB family protein [Phormidium sp. LEGE 05292]